MDRRTFLKATAAGIASLAFPTYGAAGAGRKPNFLVLVTDDQRWDCLSCMGHPILKTPALDRLAAGGVTFTNAFVTASICSASRASIISGLYARHHGVGMKRFSGNLPSRAVGASYPIMLKKAGYRVGCLGKFGIGTRGIKEQMDYWFAWSGQGGYFHKAGGERVHNSEMLTRKAEEFLRAGPAERPFCLMVNYKAPHDPFQPDPRFDDLFKDTKIPMPKTYTDKHFEAMHPLVRTSYNRSRLKKRHGTPQKYSEFVRRYLRCVAGVDRSVGRILKILDDLKLAEDTCVVFLSDNGFFLGEHGLSGKWLMYEESIRVPMIVRYPRLPNAMRGKRVESMALNIDVSPTVIDLAGLQVPAGIDGWSLAPILRGENAKWREHFFYEHHYGRPNKIAGCEGVRTAGWKYMCYIDADPVHEELYELVKDPLEEHNLASGGAHAAKLAEMRSLYGEYLKSLGSVGAGKDGTGGKGKGRRKGGRGRKKGAG
jgi:arylsulfatase A-like enzyme